MKKPLLVLLALSLIGVGAAITFDATGDVAFDQDVPKKEDTKKVSKKKGGKKKEETPKKEGSR